MSGLVFAVGLVIVLDHRRQRHRSRSCFLGARRASSDCRSWSTGPCGSSFSSSRACAELRGEGRVAGARRARWRCWRKLAVWLGFFVLGYAFMLEPTTHGFSAAFTQAAVTLFSVGTEHAGGPPNRTVDIAAGATWALVVTLQIAYLPSLYDAFNRREALVAMLESRAGLPAWGPEVLARHQLVGIIDALPEPLRRLGALGRGPGREPHHLPGPAAVPVARAVVLVGRRACWPCSTPRPWTWRCRPTASSSQARLCLRMGFTDPQPDRQDPRMARGPRPEPRRPDHLDVRGVRAGGRTCSRRSATPWS